MATPSDPPRTAKTKKSKREEILNSLTDAQLELLAFETVNGGPPGTRDGRHVGHTPWWSIARENQLPPLELEDQCLVWLILAGRGWGKTRTGAEWTRYKAERMPGSRGAYIAKDPGEARDVMIEGVSGILACSPRWFRPVYNPSLKRLTWPNGAIATVFSSEDYDELRGPQHHWLWGDEPFKWRNIDETWEQAQLGLRLGERPQACFTSTPRPLKILKQLIADPLTFITKGTTFENIMNLSPHYQSLIKKFQGTRLGRQELEAAILDDVAGALWTYKMFEDDGFRLYAIPTGLRVLRVVVGVDPQATSMSEADRKRRRTEEDDVRATGIVVVGRCDDNRGYVLADKTISGRPEAWGKQAIDAYKEFGADRIVAESNNGGEMVEAVIKANNRHVPVRLVFASRGKITRAEPISTLYERGVVSHCGNFTDLEDEMCTYVPGEASPNRMDALVWACTELFGRDIADITEAVIPRQRLLEPPAERQRLNPDLEVAVRGGSMSFEVGRSGGDGGGMNL